MVALPATENRPGDARHLVGERDRDQAHRLSGEQTGDPRLPPGDGLALVADQAGGADDQQPPEIPVGVTVAVY